MIPFTSLRDLKISFGPFNSFSQSRWKKPVVTAQVRLETRTRDLKLDKLITHLNKLKTVLKIQQLISHRKQGPFVSLQLMSRWRNIVGLNVGMGIFLHKYPHVFEVFKHPIRKNICCRLSTRFRDLIDEEKRVMKEYESELVRRIKKLLMMSKTGTLHAHALRLISRELGLPENFWDSILGKYSLDFRLTDLEIVELVARDESLTVSEVEKWREKEYTEKWLSEFETRYAFPINFPTGFKMEIGYREKLKNWQRLPYLKPYERREGMRVRTCGGVERFEKRAVGIIHELLSLTVEKMVEVDKLAHFRKDFAIQVNVRELLLKHPGIFYVSTKGSTQTVFLREAYSKGCLVETNPVYIARRKMLDLVLLGRRNARRMFHQEERIEEGHSLVSTADGDGSRDGTDWVIPTLEGCDTDNEDPLNSLDEISNSKEEFHGYCESGSCKTY
ncbi:hypothetical protein SLEP1_g27681 [Rubroshorea leprosula]|uniref:PORR domain-containing protein n=1 Tax=Rubroshorea leprosula TaxID=152421 RepID=A0AAV5K3U5_9ROSI|nr:hypothetical protein SLEP1_g27681 [Rubroshorea leprosula]